MFVGFIGKGIRYLNIKLLVKKSDIWDRFIILYFTPAIIKIGIMIIKAKFKIIFIVLLDLNLEDIRKIIVLKKVENTIGISGIKRTDIMIMIK